MGVQEKVLIVEDEENERSGLADLVSAWGYRTDTARDGLEGLEKVAAWSPGIVITDFRMPRMDGLELLQRLADQPQQIAVVLLTAQGSIDVAVDAMKSGAYDFIQKPVDTTRLKQILQNAARQRGTAIELEATKRKLRDTGLFGQMVGTSRPMREIFHLIEMVAPSTASVLITGESGTGKEMVARTIHDRSPRKSKPFVAINCSAIPEMLMEAELFGHEKGAFTDAKQMKKGLFEAADGGTLFLDEIGELSPLLQAKLLRVLEDQVIRRVGGLRDMQVDVRVIAASNRDLEKAVREGHFRQDLYYRLAIIAIFIPPLRDRKEDILPLVDFFIDRYNRRFKKNIRGITEETRYLILGHNWPGNVRELKNTIERGMILEEESFLRPVYLPFSVGESGGRTLFERTSPADGGQMLPNGRMLPRLYIPDCGTSLEEVEHSMVELAMAQAGGNQTNAAKLLDISRDALRYKLKKFGLGRGEEEG